jgi:hypothetical protein
MKNTLLLFAMLGLVGVGFAQESPSIGIRGGLANGLALKWFLAGDTEALEGIVTIRGAGTTSTLAITALYELHNYDFASEALRWYYGAGPHLAMSSQATDIGLDGIIGIEYRINEGPISLSADWKPSLAIIGAGGLVGDEGAITLRYHL